MEGEREDFTRGKKFNNTRNFSRFFSTLNSPFLSISACTDLLFRSLTLPVKIFFCLKDEVTFTGTSKY